MSSVSLFAANPILPAPADFLSIGEVLGNEVTLSVGSLYSTGFLALGALFVLSALILIWVMYQRVRFFARDFGDGGMGGRLKAISGIIIIGFFLIAIGGVLALIGLGNQGYKVVLSQSGLTEFSPSGVHTFAWSDLNRRKSSDHFKTTDFTLRFEQGKAYSCQVRLLQQSFGEEVQDKAIAIVEEAVRRLPPLTD
ncbi:MAG: hypothetical protein IPK32_00185 [Verrucomicrobiaceae bacterium]|nr:hypothetical protein [Verrucomicrobiaceae bacterium]